MSPYVYNKAIHNLQAPQVVVPLVMELIEPKSVLDVGCGTGTWLKIFDLNGVIDYVGVDAQKPDTLLIADEKFVVRDLTQPWTFDRKFDLVVSLEVGEHLPEFAAESYVKSLTQHGRNVLFSAAIPGQGGQYHINEQWPEYWQEKFAKHGFYFHDLIRPRIWNDTRVEWWYRQNIFLINQQKPESRMQTSMVHPELHERLLNQRIHDQQSLFEGRHGVLVSARIFMNALLFKFKRLFKIR